MLCYNVLSDPRPRRTFPDFRMRRLPLLLSVSLVCAVPAFAANNAQLADARLQALDERIRALEADGQKLREQAAAALAAADAARAELEKMKATLQATQQAQQAQASVAVAAPAAPAGGANGNAFNPGIAVILNGNYAHHSLNPDNYQRAGFAIVDGGPIPQGLSLGESEISFAANIDDKFYGQLTLSYEDDHGGASTSIEEAYIDTLALPDGLSVRLGRFFSNIGYLNSHHTHTDNFVDRPLPYQAFLAGQYGDDGAQLRWVAPLDVFLKPIQLWEATFRLLPKGAWKVWLAAWGARRGCDVERPGGRPGMTRYSAPTAVVRPGQWGPSACFGRATRAGPPGPGTRANAMGVRGSCRMATWAVRAAVLADRGPLLLVQGEQETHRFNA